MHAVGQARDHGGRAFLWIDMPRDFLAAHGFPGETRRGTHRLQRPGYASRCLRNHRAQRLPFTLPTLRGARASSYACCKGTGGGANISATTPCRDRFSSSMKRRNAEPNVLSPLCFSKYAHAIAAGEYLVSPCSPG
jgi:hypothetical protein